MSITRVLASRVPHPRWTVVRVWRDPRPQIRQPWIAESPGFHTLSKTFATHAEAVEYALAQAAKPMEACS